MPIMTACPKCARQISAPDAAGGRKARCPECGEVVSIPAGEAGPETPAGGDTAVREMAEVVSPPAQPAAGSKSGTPSTTRTSATTLSRLAAKTSPYGRVRLLAAILFGLGIVLGVLTFLVGLAALIVFSMQGGPMVGVFAFVAAVVAVGLEVLGAKAVSELMRVAADVGDRTRQIALFLEEVVAH